MLCGKYSVFSRSQITCKQAEYQFSRTNVHTIGTYICSIQVLVFCELKNSLEK